MVLYFSVFIVTFIVSLFIYLFYNPTGIYLLKVNNRNIKQGVNYVQS